MKLLYDLLPVLLFFGAYKFYGAIPPEVVNGFNAIPLLNLTPGEPADAIYLATAVAILAAFIQVALFWLRHHRFENMHLVSLGLITVFGGATLLVQDPVFIMWKPTVLNWLFGAVFLFTQYVGRKPLVERIMGHAIQVPRAVWARLNLAWVGFFGIAGLANLIVAYGFSEEAWVNFKLFGLMGLTLVFVLGQALYLTRYMDGSGDAGEENT